MIFLLLLQKIHLPRVGVINQLSVRQNWDLWRRRGACRIWKAVLISMAIDPETNSRTNLKKDKSHLYDEYLRRKEDVIANYGLIPEFKATNHAKAK